MTGVGNPEDMEKLLHWAVENSDAKGLEESRKNIQNLVIITDFTIKNNNPVSIGS